MSANRKSHVLWLLSFTEPLYAIKSVSKLYECVKAQKCDAVKWSNGPMPLVTLVIDKRISLEIYSKFFLCVFRRRDAKKGSYRIVCTNLTDDIFDWWFLWVFQQVLSLLSQCTSILVSKVFTTWFKINIPLAKMQFFESFYLFYVIY